MTFYVENETGALFDFDPEEVATVVAKEVLRSEGCDKEVEISLTITDDDGIQELNRQFREIDRPTDVLSFPSLPLRLLPCDRSRTDEACCER